MGLPPRIEIVPPADPVRATVTVPGSKSITNRALVLGALGTGTTTLRGALWSEDTEAMVACLRALGFEIDVASEADEPANRTIAIDGLGGLVPPGGTEQEPLRLFVGNAGTAARFLMAMLCPGSGVYELSGVARMHERPQAELVNALRALGYRIDTGNGRLPARIYGGGRKPGRCSVGLDDSSQFASALLLSAPVGGWEVEVLGHDAEESPYVEMTQALLASFPKGGGEVVVEPDASSGSYLWAAGHLLGGGDSEISVARWPSSRWQVDEDFPLYLPLPTLLSRQSQLGDSIMTAIVMAPFADHPVRFTDLGRLRLQECERVEALRTELTKCGARVKEEGDSLIVEPSELHGAEIETYGDHRMAMCFAVVGLRVPGIVISDPACVAKTFPNFFQKLAGRPPGGLGVEIRNAGTGRPLAFGDLLPGEGRPR